MKVAVFDGATGTAIAMFSQTLPDLLMTLAAYPNWNGLPLRVLDETTCEYAMVLDAIPDIELFDQQNPSCSHYFVDTSTNELSIGSS